MAVLASAMLAHAAPLGTCKNLGGRQSPTISTSRSQKSHNQWMSHSQKSRAFWLEKRSNKKWMVSKFKDSCFAVGIHPRNPQLTLFKY